MKGARARGASHLRIMATHVVPNILPPAVVQYTVDDVSIKKIAYWVADNTLNVPLPSVDLYVAPAAAKELTLGGE